MSDIKLITPEELEARLEQRDDQIQVVDVREDEEVESGKIQQALHIPLAEVPNRTGELDQTKTIVMVCRSGRRSERAAEYLQTQGFDVLNMEGGMLKWTGEVHS